ncbi:hypothetical protein [Hymenobacter guriensis]|uniref:Uncharacterized protein n=1 Tax=Hymenobacter guriensis TaxID=2793065 RepID=A0ABS0L7V6_9BACT|nr:hypothetical protein [Hymenobacter guriensis]MBG8556159.1 hypothetical protein [Hymenobacter guriensis]
MLQLETPTGYVLTVTDTIRDVSAGNYLRFSQACSREAGLGSDMRDANSHLRRIGMFQGAKKYDAATEEWNNLMLCLNNLESGESTKAEALATVVISIAQPADSTLEGKPVITGADVLATGLTQQQLEETLDAVKKNFSVN